MRVLYTNTIWSGVSAARWPHIDCMCAPPNDRYCPYPFWLSIAAAAAKRAGHEARMVNPYAEYLDEDRYYRIVGRFSPDVVVLESNTRTYNLDLQIAGRIRRETDAEIVMVGTMPTAVPEKVLGDGGADYIVRGEYEFAVTDILNALEGGGDVDGVRGIGYRLNETVKLTEERPLCDLDELPYPNWEDDNLWLYNDGFIRHYPSLQVHASRGCMFRCPYCQWNQLMYRERYRMFSNRYVVDMINYGLDCLPACREIYFDDDNFTQRPEEEMVGLCKMIVEQGWNLPFSTMGHAGTVSTESLKWMRKAGLYACKWGLETHDQNILNNLKKGLVLSKFEETIRQSSDLGIINHVTVMFGLPGQDYRSCLKTIEYVLNLYRRHLIDTVQFSIATPFIGTRFYEEAVVNGWIRGEDFERFDGKSNSVISYPTLSAEEIEKALKIGVDRMWRARALRFLKNNLTNPKAILLKLAQHVERTERE